MCIGHGFTILLDCGCLRFIWPDDPGHDALSAEMLQDRPIPPGTIAYCVMHRDWQQIRVIIVNNAGRHIELPRYTEQEEEEE